MEIKWVLGIILSGIVVIFVVQNVEVVQINFLFWSFSMSRALLLFFVLITGVLIGWLIRSYRLKIKKTSAQPGK